MSALLDPFAPVHSHTGAEVSFVEVCRITKQKEVQRQAHLSAEPCRDQDQHDIRLLTRGRKLWSE